MDFELMKHSITDRDDIFDRRYTRMDFGPRPDNTRMVSVLASHLKGERLVRRLSVLHRLDRTIPPLIIIAIVHSVKYIVVLSLLQVLIVCDFEMDRRR